MYNTPNVSDGVTKTCVSVPGLRCSASLIPEQRFRWRINWHKNTPLLKKYWNDTEKSKAIGSVVSKRTTTKISHF